MVGKPVRLCESRRFRTFTDCSLLWRLRRAVYPKPSSHGWQATLFAYCSLQQCLERALYPKVLLHDQQATLFAVWSGAWRGPCTLNPHCMAGRQPYLLIAVWSGVWRGPYAWCTQKLSQAQHKTQPPVQSAAAHAAKNRRRLCY